MDRARVPALPALDVGLRLLRAELRRPRASVGWTSPSGPSRPVGSAEPAPAGSGWFLRPLATISSSRPRAHRRTRSSKSALASNSAPRASFARNRACRSCGVATAPHASPVCVSHRCPGCGWTKKVAGGVDPKADANPGRAVRGGPVQDFDLSAARPRERPELQVRLRRAELAPERRDERIEQRTLVRRRERRGEAARERLPSGDPAEAGPRGTSRVTAST
jgi:hypothetical protein